MDQTISQDTPHSNLSHDTSGSYSMYPNKQYNRPALLAILVGIFAIITSILVGWLAYHMSRQIFFQQAAKRNLTVARSIANYPYTSQTDTDNLDAFSFFQIKHLWDQLEQSSTQAFLCVVDPHGKMVVCTANENMEGGIVTDLPLDTTENNTHCKTIGDLLKNQQEYWGENITLSGQKQVVGFSYSNTLNHGILVHIPIKEIEHLATEAASPWGFGVGVIVILIPLALMLMHRSYSLTSKALINSELRYRNVVEDQTEFIVRWLPDGVRTFVNESYCRYFGYPREELIGKSFFSQIYEKDLNKIKKKIKSITPKNPLVVDEHRVLRSDGSVAWNQWVDRGVFDPLGRIIEYQSVGRDITDRKLAEESIRYRADFDRLILEISTRFINISPNQVDQTIIDALGEIGRFANVAMGYLFFFSDDGDHFSMTHYWSTDAIKGDLAELKNLDATAMPWWMNQIRANEMVIVNSVDDLPPDASVEKGIQKSLGLNAVIDIPIISTGKIIGFMGFGDTNKKQWTEDEINLLKMIRQVFVNALNVKVADQALSVSEEKYRSIVETTQEWIWEINTEGVHVFSNSAIENILGYRVDEIIGKSSLSFMHPDDRKTIEAILPDLIEKKQSWKDWVIRWQHKDGQYRYLESHAVALVDPQTNQLKGYIGVDRDITDRREADLKLLENQEKLRSLASELSLTEEKSRRRIATALHDQLGALLAISSMKLSELSHNVSDQHQIIVQDVIDTIEKSIHFSRELMLDLSPPELYEFGLEAAIERLLENTEKKHGIQCQLLDDALDKPLSEETRITLYQSVQEVLINTIKHAQASSIQINIQKINDLIQINIKDDGIGFDINKLQSMDRKKSGFGLFNIRERLKYLGGNLKIESTLKKGTTITLNAHLDHGGY